MKVCSTGNDACEFVQYEEQEEEEEDDDTVLLEQTGLSALLKGSKVTACCPGA